MTGLRDRARLRELELMARKYALNGEMDKAIKIIDWSPNLEFLRNEFLSIEPAIGERSNYYSAGVLISSGANTY